MERQRASIQGNDKEQAVNWLRAVLTVMLNFAPVPRLLKKRTVAVIQRTPGWLLRRWAEILNIDYITAYQAYPDLPDRAQSELGRKIVQQYVEEHHVVTRANRLQQLVGTALKLIQTGTLPLAKDVVERHICALGLADCFPYKVEFIEPTNPVTADRYSDSMLIEYRTALEQEDRNKLEEADAILSRGQYAKWVSERIQEVKSWLGLDVSYFNIRYGERTPEWDILWKIIFIGGKNEQ